MRGGEDEQCREEGCQREENKRRAAQHHRALNRAPVRGVARDTRLHLFSIRRLDALNAVEPPRAMTKDIFTDFARAQDAGWVSQSYPLNFSSNSCSVFSNFSCRAAIVKSPRVRSKTPRTISVVRRKPPVSASGKSIVTRSE